MALWEKSGEIWFLAAIGIVLMLILKECGGQ